MNRFLFAFVGLLICPQAWAQSNEPVPVIIIMADQLRFDAVGEWTPNIRQLQEDGVNFSRTYCSSPICVPSRGSFFTGLYPNRTGSLINGWEDEDSQHGLVAKGTPNLYSTMEKEWDSWHVGKQHFLTEEKIDGHPQSLTRWITQKDYSTWVKGRGAAKPGGQRFKTSVPEMVSGQHTHLRDYSVPVVEQYAPGLSNFLDHYIGNESVAAIRNRNKDKPLLLNAMFLAPHPPFHIPEPYFSLFDDRTIDVPENVGVWYPRQSPLQLYNITGFLGTRYSRQDWEVVWKKYLGLVKLLDDEVGRIIKTLKEEGIYEKAIIVFTADHGEMLGSHSLWQKMCMYEESARVPLIIKFPESVRMHAKEVSTPVSLVDVFPTLLEVTGLPVPENLDGRSLIPMVQPGSKENRDVFIQYDGNGSLGNFQRCLVRSDYKLIVDIFKDEVFLELYNVANDRQETTNLAFDDRYKSTTIELLNALKNKMKTSGDRLELPGDVYEVFRNHYQKILK